MRCHPRCVLVNAQVHVLMSDATLRVAVIHRLTLACVCQKPMHHSSAAASALLIGTLAFANDHDAYFIKRGINAYKLSAGLKEVRCSRCICCPACDSMN